MKASFKKKAIGVKRLAFFKRDRELPEEFKDRYNLATVDLIAGEYNRAIEQYEAILEQFPRNGQVWLEYAHALLGAGSKDKAKEAIEAARKYTKIEDSILGIDNPHTMVEFGILMEEEGQPKIAEKIYGAVTESTPTWYRPWFLLATIFKKREKFKRAEEIFRKGIESSKEETERLMIGLAEVLTLQHRFEEGLSFRRKAIEANPDYVEAWLSFAVDSYQFGDYDEGEAALAKARELSRNDSKMLEVIEATVEMLEEHLKKCPKGMDEGEYMFSMGAVHYQNQNFERARKALEKAVRLRPKHAESWALLGGILVQLQELREAEKACKTAISLDSKSVGAYQVLSSIRTIQGNMNEAIEVLRDGIAANPQESSLRKMLAEVEKIQSGDQVLTKKLAEAEEQKDEGMKLLAEGKLDKALKNFNKVVKLIPEDADAWAQLGLIYVNLKKYNDGEKAAREAIRLEEDNAIAWGVLGAALGDAGKLEEAEHALTRAVELDPNNASNILPLGFIHMQRGNLDMAQIMLEKVVKLKPTVAVAWHMLSQVYDLQGKHDEAVDASTNAQKFGMS
ncbi:tetratricopeptide repeat protein [Candidatus Thorarchaeota archaeon]|nr:MAG: tetratricopeptide repeat protein [Candidatus Thorarchaeota archaeon]